VTPTAITPYVRLALDCIRREYPNQVALRLRSDDDLRPPRELTPAFYGCYDWHSAVHGHWLLARAVVANDPLADDARRALAESLTVENVAHELLYLEPRPTFERPYGLAWLLALHGEMRASGDWALRPLARIVAPLAMLVAGRFASWLPKLSHPIRTGTHNQTAFALGLVLDWAEATGSDELAALVRQRALDFYGDDRDLPLHLEPSGEDFLSPSLGEADLMARVLPARELASWLTRALPDLASALPTPADVTDPTDGRLAHLDGLNLSRAFMLYALAHALPERDGRVERLEECARVHEAAGVGAITSRPYEGTHWLGTFAAYLLTHPARLTS
jgi:hypothetical protein